MAEKFYSVITKTGQAKISNAIALGQKISFSKMKLGDSNGVYYEPTEEQTDLVHTVYEVNINEVSIDKDNPNWIHVTALIPSTDGGWTVREYGVYDDNDDLIAICKCAETYKPIISDGSIKELLMDMVLCVVNTDVIELKIDPTIVFATKQDIIEIRNEINNGNFAIKFERAGGTANNIGLTILSTLYDGYSKSFIATKNSTGSVKINSSFPLYRQNSTESPKLYSGKAYTIWYDKTNTCFFLKASAEGDAIEENVLAGKYFSNGEETNLLGTMPNNGRINKVLALNESLTLPKGYYDGIKINQSLNTLNGITNAISQRVDDSYLYTSIPRGAYFTNSSSSNYPEIKSKLTDVTDALKKLPEESKNKVFNQLGTMKTYTFNQIYSGSVPTGKILRGICDNKIVILNNYTLSTFDLNTYSVTNYTKNTSWGTPLSDENCYFLNGNIVHFNMVIDLNQNSVSVTYGGQGSNGNHYLSFLGQEYAIESEKVLVINNVKYDLIQKDSNGNKLTHNAGELWGDWIFFKTGSGDMYAYNYITKVEKNVFSSHDGSSHNICYDKYDDSLVIRYSTSQSGSESYTHSGIKKFYKDGGIVEVFYNESNRSYNSIIMPTSYGSDIFIVPFSFVGNTWTEYNNKVVMSEGKISIIKDRCLIYKNKIYAFNNNNVVVYEIS